MQPFDVLSEEELQSFCGEAGSSPVQPEAHHGIAGINLWEELDDVRYGRANLQDDVTENIINCI